MTQKSVELAIANEELKRLSDLKTTFVSSVSHELRTPLTVIKEFIALLIEEKVGRLSEEQKEYLGIANKNILRLTNLIETLLDFARIESGKGLKLKFEPAKLRDILEDALAEEVGQEELIPVDALANLPFMVSALSSMQPASRRSSRNSPSLSISILRKTRSWRERKRK
jgi:signal transduction histidine kinase